MNREQRRAQQRNRGTDKTGWGKGHEQPDEHRQQCRLHRAADRMRQLDEAALAKLDSVNPGDLPDYDALVKDADDAEVVLAHELADSICAKDRPAHERIFHALLATANYENLTPEQYGASIEPVIQAWVRQLMGRA